jgi:hypothetical protein
MAEIEIGGLKRQCLDRRIYDAAIRRRRSLRCKAADAADGLINWQFITDDARTKLRRLYPVSLTGK